MGVELILNSANINYIAFSHFSSGRYDGQIFAIFVIMLAAAEAVIGLAIVPGIYQNFATIHVEATDNLQGETMEHPLLVSYLRWIVLLPLLGAAPNGILGATMQKR